MKKIGTIQNALIIRIKAFRLWMKKNNSIALDALVIGIGTFLLGMAKPALVILGIAAIFLFSWWVVPRLGEWFMSTGVAICVAAAALSILREASIRSEFFIGTFLGSVILITLGAMLIRRKKLQYGEFAGEMAELQEVIGDVEVSE